MEKITGNALYYFKKYVLDNFGADGWQKLVDAADDSIKATLGGGIMSQEYYDRTVFQGALAAFDKTFGREQLLKAAEYQATKQVSGFYGMIAKLISLDTAFRQLGPMFRKTWTAGKMEIVEKRDGYFKIILSEFPMNDSHLHHLECFLRTNAEIIGKKKFKTTAKAIDSQTTEYTFTEQA